MTDLCAASALEQEALEILEGSRPPSLRRYDQIPMFGADLLRGVKAAAPRLAGLRVAFVGDHDGTSLLLGLLAKRGLIPPPRSMALLDFDERLLVQARTLASRYGFDDLLETQLYNVFDPVPAALAGRFDAYYTNPPYGASNDGASVRLFVTRGSELTGHPGATGHILLPCDSERAWTVSAKECTEKFLVRHGWRVIDFQPGSHGYHLDDDPTLTSALLLVQRSEQNASPMPWTARQIDHHDIPHFYGQAERAPYPQFIAANGQAVWKTKVAG